MNHDQGEKDAFKDLDFFVQNLLIPLMSFVALGIVISLFSHFLGVKKEEEQKTFCV